MKFNFNIINLLIVFFIILIFYQILLENTNLTKIVEGLTDNSETSSSNNQYQPYDSNDPNILSQQNAGNIQVLKQQIDGLLPLNKEVQDLSGNVATLTEQVNTILVQLQLQQQLSTDASGNTTTTPSTNFNSDNLQQMFQTTQ